MRLWIDSAVPPTDTSFDWAMTGEDAISIIESGKVSYISIGYNVDGRWTGYTLLLWLRQSRFWPQYGVHVHGGDRIQRQEMVDLCRGFHPR